MEEDKKRISFADAKGILARYASLERPHRSYFWLSLLVYGAGVIVSDVLSIWVYKELIDSLTDGEALSRVWLLVGLVITAYVSFFVLNRLGDRFYRIHQVGVSRDLSLFAFSRLQGHSYAFFADRFSGGLVSQARRFIDGAENLTDALVFTYWTQSLALLGTLGVIFVYSWKLALGYLVCMIFSFAIVVPLIRKRMEYNAREAVEESKVTGIFSDVITNILAVKTFARSGAEESRYRKQVERQMEFQDHSWRAGTLMNVYQNGVLMVVRMGLLAASVYLWSQGEISVGTIVLVFAYSQQLFFAAWDFSRGTTRLLRTLAKAQEAAELFDEPYGVSDSQQPASLTVTKGAIEFRDVVFTYQAIDRVFDGFSLGIQPQEKIGLVGPSGGGKSTLTKLLLRFVDPQGGQILIDGQDIRRVRQDDLRHQIAYVPQEPLLFHRTLFENIAYGKEGATREEVVAAAQKAHADEFIVKLEKGYDTLVGERGVKLSGGQRQRVAIARAILKDAPILVLDEATSALDTVSEMKIREALDELMRNKTAIIIAHRLSTVEKLDRIIVLDKEGRIAEAGTHAELVGRDGLYAELWRHQTGGFLDDGALEAENAG